jgi:homoserine O-acetyltransferase
VVIRFIVSRSCEEDMTTCTPSSERLQAPLPGNPHILDIDGMIPLPDGFRLDSGETVGKAIRARLVGSGDKPVVLVLGGISANRHVCDASASQTPQSGWWREAVGPGGILDTQKVRILSFDFLPGDEDGEVTITPRDQARLAQLVCDYFRIERVQAFIGYSYGGMVALHFGALFPERVERLIVTSASHRPHPMGTAWRSIQRKIVRFGLETSQPERALSLARELGMTTYRTAWEFGERFSSNQSGVEEYLTARGEAFIGKMSPQRYLSLSQSIDLHQVAPEAIRVPITLVGFRQDQLVLLEEMRQLCQKLPRVQGYYEFDSIYGHDAFLKEIPLLSPILKEALYQ